MDALLSTGKKKQSGRDLWIRAKQVIPGGNMLLSKRPTRFHPKMWPTYFSKAHGCAVWDLDGRKFHDLSLMGVGTNLLGYGDKSVDSAVRRVVRNGNMSTLNAPEEVQLAEMLLGLNPWAGMVRFARTGGEANAVALRLARAASGKDAVAICGYHGWHDWYLSVNLMSDSGLDGHLLPGLNPVGVPRTMAGQVHGFEYNRLDQLIELTDHHDIGVIFMEVSRGTEPEEDFLTGVRDLANRKGIVLVFDECTSGFRETPAGLHQKYGVTPDLAVYGKALGNGYAITAVVGLTEVMQWAQESFISSTFWTERIGSAAAVATLSRMATLKSWETVSEIGRHIKSEWERLSRDLSLGIEITGIDALPGFRFPKSDENALFKTFITQEMLRRGFLATSAIYVSLAHTQNILARYFQELESVLTVVSEAGVEEIERRLEGPVASEVFARLN